MKHRISTSILIKAPKQIVWDILTDFQNYQNWNPFIKSASGEPILGQKLKVHIQPPGGSGMSFRPEIVELQKEKELAWLGRLGFPGIFDGRHEFKLEEAEDGETLFIHSENFSGILVPFMKKGLDKKAKKGFENMNTVLKSLAEKQFIKA
jgi:hypothetical protein